VRTTILLGAGASVGAGIPPARQLLEKALGDAEPWEELGVSPARGLLCRVTELCKPYWEERPDRKALGDVFEIEALVNTVHAIASRENWWGYPFVAEWVDLLHELDVEAEALKTSFSPTMPLAYLEGTPKAGQSIPCDWDGGGDEWQSPFAALRSILLLVVTRLTALSPHANVHYLEPIITKWLDDGRTTVGSLNYDNALETAARNLYVDVDHGISDYRKSRRVHFSFDRLPLLKLHGSGSWAEQRIAGEHTSGEDFRYEPWADIDANHHNGKWIQPAIIMGGENKLQARGPFLELYMELKDRLRSTERLVVVGYSFRDRHINEAIRVWIRDTPWRNELRLVVVAPSERYPVRGIYATHRDDIQAWLRCRADKEGVLDLALHGSTAEIRDAAVPDLWNPGPLGDDL
jgi:hypothetical protein